MARNRLKEKLEALMGEEETEFVIPYPLLPPRFFRLSRGRNMLLRSTPSVEVFVCWEGERFGSWHVLTPRQVCWLLRDVGKKMLQYRKDLETLAFFFQENAIFPIPDPALLDPTSRVVPIEAGIEKPKRVRKQVEVCAQIQDTAPISIGAGGESPWPHQDY